MSQTHLISFNGRQWGISQSISGVSGSSGGLRSQNFDFLTKKKFLRKCSYLGNRTSHRVGSGVKTTVRPRATCMTIHIKCISSSFHDRLGFIKHLYFHGIGQKSDSDLLLPFLTPPLPTRSIFFGSKCLQNMSHE